MILSGIYNNFTPVSNTTYNGSAIFTGVIQLGNVQNVLLDGNFILSGGTIDPGNGNNINIHFNGWDFGNNNIVFQDKKPFVIYNGTPQSCLYYGLTITNFKFSGQCIYQGTWEAPATFHNVNINMFVSGGTIVNNNTQSNKFFGNSLYNFQIYNLNISGPNSPNGDSGVIFIESGNGTVGNIKRIGGLNYIMRMVVCSLVTPSTSTVFNVIDYGTSAYGTIDIRTEPGLLLSGGTITLVGGSFQIIDCTSGDKTDDGSYVTPMIVIGAMADNFGTKYSVTVENCFAFNAMINGMSNNSSLIKDNSNGLTNIFKYNNYDVVGPLPSGVLVDKINFYPISGSPLIGAAKPLSSYQSDIYGNPRITPLCIGAVQFVPAAIPIPTIKSITINYSDGSSKTVQ